LANNPRAFPQVAVTQADAWRLYDAFISNPRIQVAFEPPLLESLWRQSTQLPQFSPQRWSDAYLAAFAQAANFELVTFDKGFAQYRNLRQTVLS
jgi:predicted nucleic acid-binding protein